MYNSVVKVRKVHKLGIFTLLLIGSILISILLSGCYFFPKEEETLAPPIKEPEKVVYDTIEVKTGKIEKVVRCSGTFTSAHQIDIMLKNRGYRIQSINVRIGDTVKKGQVIAQMQTDNLLNDIALAEIDLKKAEISYDKIKTQADISGGGSKYDLELAELDVKANRIRLDIIKGELEATRLVSPIDGEIIYIKEVKEGDYINTYDSIVRIADPKILNLVYTGDRVQDFPLGAVVELKINDFSCKGKVVGTPRDIPHEADEQAKSMILIKPDQVPEDVTIGNQADITLVLERKENVIVLPKSVVNNFMGRKFVNVLKDGIREERDLELGLQSDTEVEVVKGLEPGDLVLEQ